LDAIILAGALNTGPLQEICTARYEAEIDIAGRPMLEYIVKALKQVSSIERIVVSGPQGILAGSSLDLIFQLVEPGSSMIDSLVNGLNVLDGNQSVLVITADIPLITAEALEDFLVKCRLCPGDVYYSFIAKEVCEAKYPGVHRTYVKLREGTFTGGNVALISGRVIRDNIEMLKKAAALRKKPLQLCSMLGWKCFFQLMIGRLNISQIENRIAKAFNFKAVGVVSAYPEIGIDVDKPSDLVLARQILSKVTN